MSCIFNIPKESRNNCKYCTVLYCDERPQEQNTISATRAKAMQQIQNLEVSTVNQLLHETRDVLKQLISGDIPILLNGKLIKIKKVELVDTPDYGYVENISFKYDMKIIKKK